MSLNPNEPISDITRTPMANEKSAKISRLLAVRNGLIEEIEMMHVITTDFFAPE